MIPGNTAAASALKAIRAGNLIRLNGDLVEVRGTDGFTWRSSLSRTDTGSGACELVWVDNISVQ
jgi:hypothetical protein